MLDDRPGGTADDGGAGVAADPVIFIAGCERVGLGVGIGVCIRRFTAIGIRGVEPAVDIRTVGHVQLAAVRRGVRIGIVFTGVGVTEVRVRVDDAAVIGVRNGAAAAAAGEQDRRERGSEDGAKQQTVDRRPVHDGSAIGLGD